MATVTITFTDTDEEKGSVQISMTSEPPFDDVKGTAAQSLGVRVLDILNQQLDKEEAEDNDQFIVEVLIFERVFTKPCLVVHDGLPRRWPRINDAWE